MTLEVDKLTMEDRVVLAQSSGLLSIFEDPISFEIMEKAMMTPCGHSFSEETITNWISKKGQCPLCNKPLRRTDITPNYALRNAIARFVTAQAHLQQDIQNAIGNVSLSSEWSTPGPTSDWTTPTEQEEGLSTSESKLLVEVISARDLKTSWFGNADPYCVLEFQEQKRKTSVTHRRDPEWSEIFVFNVKDTSAESNIMIALWDKETLLKDKFLGMVTVPLAEVITALKMVRRFVLQKARPNSKKKIRGDILLRLQFLDLRANYEFGRSTRSFSSLPPITPRLSTPPSANSNPLPPPFPPSPVPFSLLPSSPPPPHRPPTPPPSPPPVRRVPSPPPAPRNFPDRVTVIPRNPPPARLYAHPPPPPPRSYSPPAPLRNLYGTPFSVSASDIASASSSGSGGASASRSHRLASSNSAPLFRSDEDHNSSDSDASNDGAMANDRNSNNEGNDDDNDNEDENHDNNERENNDEDNNNNDENHNNRNNRDDGADGSGSGNHNESHDQDRGDNNHDEDAHDHNNHNNHDYDGDRSNNNELNDDGESRHDIPDEAIDIANIYNINFETLISNASYSGSAPNLGDIINANEKKSESGSSFPSLPPPPLPPIDRSDWAFEDTDKIPPPPINILALRDVASGPTSAFDENDEDDWGEEDKSGSANCKTEISLNGADFGFVYGTPTIPRKVLAPASPSRERPIEVYTNTTHVVPFKNDEVECIGQNYHFKNHFSMMGAADSSEIAQQLYENLHDEQFHIQLQDTYSKPQASTTSMYETEEEPEEELGRERRNRNNRSSTKTTSKITSPTTTTTTTSSYVLNSIASPPSTFHVTTASSIATTSASVSPLLSSHTSSSSLISPHSNQFTPNHSRQNSTTNPILPSAPLPSPLPSPRRTNSPPISATSPNPTPNHARHHSNPSLSAPSSTHSSPNHSRNNSGSNNSVSAMIKNNRNNNKNHTISSASHLVLPDSTQEPVQPSIQDLASPPRLPDTRVANEESVKSLMEMGFARDLAEFSLKTCNNDMESALDKLLSNSGQLQFELLRSLLYKYEL